MIQLLLIFHGLENANPYVHIREFEEVVATFQSRADMLDTIKLRFLPFSLKNNANVWLYSLRPRSINSWDEMIQDFSKSISQPIRPITSRDKSQTLHKKRVKPYTKFGNIAKTF